LFGAILLSKEPLLVSKLPLRVSKLPAEYVGRVAVGGGVAKPLE
jgi:hypothetical protein